MGENEPERRNRVIDLRPPALLFGMPIADLTLDETIESIGELIQRGRATGSTHQVTTVNVDFLVNARKDPDLRAIIRTSDLSLADGMPIKWTATLFGMPIHERVAGADLVPRIIEASERFGWQIHFFGSSEQVAHAARALIAERYPLASVTIEPGPIISDPTDVADEVLDAIRQVDADVLCVALGNPKQERFIRSHRDRLGTPVMIGVGGSLDLLVGDRKRAPTWMQRIGLEWVARALQEPVRLGSRYRRDLRVLARRMLPVYRAHHRRRSHPGYAFVRLDEQVVSVRLGVDVAVERNDWATAARFIRAGADFVVDPGDATAINDRALAHLVGLVRVARLAGCDARWLDDPHPTLIAMLRIRNIAVADLGWDEL